MSSCIETDVSFREILGAIAICMNVLIYLAPKLLEVESFFRLIASNRRCFDSEIQIVFFVAWRYFLVARARNWSGECQAIFESWASGHGLDRPSRHKLRMQVSGHTRATDSDKVSEEGSYVELDVSLW